MDKCEIIGFKIKQKLKLKHYKSSEVSHLIYSAAGNGSIDEHNSIIIYKGHV